MKLKKGDTLITLRGETDSDEHDNERITPAGTVGIITDVLPDQFDCYSVVFPATSGWIFLNDPEVSDPAQYRVLEGAEAELASIRCRVRMYDTQHISEPEAVPTGEHYNNIFQIIGA